jgi:hypothetical protein
VTVTVANTVAVVVDITLADTVAVAVDVTTVVDFIYSEQKALAPTERVLYHDQSSGLISEI